MGKGESDDWDEKPHYVQQTQPEKHEDTKPKKEEKDKDKEKKKGCPKCCLKFRDCMMSPECGRALQISSVVAWCGMCINMWTFRPKNQDESRLYVLWSRQGLQEVVGTRGNPYPYLSMTQCANF
ncbi:hypothetical protein FQA47_023098 [Oryzias melastigma]|uniref:Uncharacterized protein n=1 Tax=Oryzias melastigma TaxID=30732 RepID=A0A834FM75_ORYME|nr:hypothetical protein FQA47_023098 [Oryzias melastigma]